MPDINLNCLSFLLKLNAINTRRSINKTGKMAKVLPSYTVTIFCSR